MYDKHRLEAYIDLWFVGRAVGRTLTELLGIEQCGDSCPLHRERWELFEGPHGPYFRCHVCHLVDRIRDGSKTFEGSMIFWN